MDNVEAKMDGVTTKVDEAFQAAKEATEGVKKVEAMVEEEKKNREVWQAGLEERLSAVEFAESAEDVKPSDPEIDKKLKDIEKKLEGMSTTDPWGGWKDRAKHSPSAPTTYAQPTDAEKRSRTVTFGPFPEDTKAGVIKEFIEGKMADVRSDIEETFAFGKMRAEKGGARFKTGEAMWKYMKANAGNHKHSFNEKSIYANVDINLKETSADETKVKAMRKVVRIVIEKNGGDGKEVKKHLETKYGKGRVWWKDERIQRGIKTKKK
jgi:hypothetical protein